MGDCRTCTFGDSPTVRDLALPYRFYSRALPWHKVVDLGSGDNPHPRANVVLDAFLENEDRQGELVTRQRTVLGHLEELPFRTGSFDLALCAHCLEHLDNPEKAISEICRIAGRAVIEVPSPYLEFVMTANDRHKWIFAKRGTELIYAENPFRNLDQQLAFHTTLLALRESRLFRVAYLNLDPIYRVRVRWRGALVLRRTTPSVVINEFLDSQKDLRTSRTVWSMVERCLGWFADRWLFIR